MTPDIEGAREFYKNLFGWNLKVSPEYTEIDLGSTGIGGMMQHHARDAGDADRLDAVLLRRRRRRDASKRSNRSGGKVYMGPHEIPNVGRFAVCADPQGAMFNIIQPERDVERECRAAARRPCIKPLLLPRVGDLHHLEHLPVRAGAPHLQRVVIVVDDRDLSFTGEDLPVIGSSIVEVNVYDLPSALAVPVETIIDVVIVSIHVPSTSS